MSSPYFQIWQFFTRWNYKFLRFFSLSFPLKTSSSVLFVSFSRYLIIRFRFGNVSCRRILCCYRKNSLEQQAPLPRCRTYRNDSRPITTYFGCRIQPTDESTVECAIKIDSSFAPLFYGDWHIMQLCCLVNLFR